MLATIKRHRERFAGGVISGFGVAAALIARTYEIGTLRRMGPGLFPLILACLMIAVGILIAVNREVPVADLHEPDGLEHPEWRGWACILAGVAAFVVLARPVGMLPATFACVFIAAMGDRTMRWSAALLLAAGIALAGTALFYYGLQIQLPPLAWSWR